MYSGDGSNANLNKGLLSCQSKVMPYIVRSEQHIADLLIKQTPVCTHTTETSMLTCIATRDRCIENC